MSYFSNHTSFKYLKEFIEAVCVYLLLLDKGVVNKESSTIPFADTYS